MPLTGEDCRSILRHLRRKVSHGLPDVDERIMSDFTLTEDSRRDLRRYLDALITILALRSMEGYQRTLGLLNEYVRPAEGPRITEIDVALSPEERAFHRVESVSLSGDPAVATLIEELERLRADFEGDDT